MVEKIKCKDWKQPEVMLVEEECTKYSVEHIANLMSTISNYKVLPKQVVRCPRFVHTDRTVFTADVGDALIICYAYENREFVINEMCQ